MSARHLAAAALACALCAGLAPAGALAQAPAPATSAVAASPGPQAGAAPPGAGDASPLLWGALGLSGAAVLLACGALTLAWGGRRRSASDARAVPPEPARLAERVARLEAALRAPASAAGPVAVRAAEPSPAARDPFPPPSPPSREGRPGARADPPLRTPAPRAGPLSVGAWAAEVGADFAEVARDPSSAVGGFIARHRPRGAAFGPAGFTLLEVVEGARLWALPAPAPGDEEVWALTPSEQAAMNWSAHFAPQRTQLAAEVYGEAFDLEEGGGEALRLVEPALVRRDASGRFSVRRRGRLSGFRG